MADTVEEVEVQAPENRFEVIPDGPPAEMEFEVVDSTPAVAPDPEMERIKADLVARTAELERERGTQNGFGSLAKSLEALKPQAPQVSVQRPLTQAELDASKEKLNERFFTDPAGTFFDLMERVNGAQVPVQAEQNLAYSRKLALVDPAAKAFVTRFGTEIERELALMPTDIKARDPNVYERAMSIVKGAHFDELVAEAAAKLGPQPAAAPAARRPAQFSEVSGTAVAPVAPNTSKIRITKQQDAEAQAFADTFGLSKATVLEQWRQSGRV